MMIRLKKVLVVFLIFTMTFSNFAFVTKSLASTGFVTLFGSTKDDSVEFEAYLASGDEITNSIVSDVNNEDLLLNLSLQVQESGYLKNGKIEILDKEGENLSFAIKEENDVQDLVTVEKLEENVLTLNKIEKDMGKIEISLPIEYVMEEYVKENKLDSQITILLSGTYMDSEGDENEISKEVKLELSWIDEREVSVQTAVSKYIRFDEDGAILQTVVTVDRSNENENSLPVKETELEIEVPNMNGTFPTDVTVVANSTTGTNGKSVGEVTFNQDNWNYDEKEHRLYIKTENNQELIDVKNEEYLKEDEEQKQEERYYSVAGMDEYVVTYSFQDAEILEEMKVSPKAIAKVTLLSGKQDEITAESSEEFILSGQTGNIVSYQIENETKDISKIYGYLNKETEYLSKTAMNVSYKDIVEEIIVTDNENYYLDKAGNKVENDDLYYKEISINKENFQDILGEDGTIEVLDATGNGLVTVNKDMETDENGNYVVNFQDRVSRITLKTSRPVNTGNLVVSNKKAISNNSMENNVYANMAYIATDTMQKAKFTYVSDYADLESITTKTMLNDTTTDFNLVVDKNSLSTVTTNSNMEMRLELNNDEPTSDKYGNSIFEIEMPQQVTGLNVTNASILYGEGLDIANVETYEREGNPVIKLTIAGEQADLNSGVLTNGTNIIVNADVDVDMYTPLQETEIKAYCYNSEATSYANAVEHALEDSAVVGYKETTVEYSAPYGVVSVNTISNYEMTGKMVSSVKQGEQVDYIDIYSEAKNATMEIAVMNNEEKAISDLTILGRVPFKGVKSIEANKDLGTTLDTKMLGNIVANELNQGEFVIYYSENGEANKDLTDEENGWTLEPENLENVKSYLIVAKDSSYVLEPSGVIRFAYNYAIPENLGHNENIYGTFATYYKEDGMDKVSEPDKVGVTTGAGPKLSLDMETDVKSVRAMDTIKATVKVKNTGADVAQNVLVNIPVPNNTSFVSSEANLSKAEISLQENSLVCTVGQLEKEEELEINLKLTVNSEYEQDKIEITAIATAKDLQKELTIKADDITIEKSEIAIEQYLHYDDPSEMFKKGKNLLGMIILQNMTDEDLRDVKAVVQLPNEIEFSKGFVYKGEDAVYDENTHQVTYHLERLGSGQKIGLNLYMTIGNLEEGMMNKRVAISTEVSADKTDTYKAQDLWLNVGKSSVSITQNSTTSTYVKEGEMINYTFTIKNEGAGEAVNVVLTDVIPEGVVVRKMTYSVGGENFENTMSETETAQLTVSVPGNSEVEVNVEAIASGLVGVKEKTVTNAGMIASEAIEEMTSNSITHIIQAEENEEEEERSSSSNNSTTSSNTTTNYKDVTRSYKLSGTAWLDRNENGVREEEEKRMSDITAILVDSTSGVIKSTTTTNSKGEYTFTGIQNGSYLVLFKYDTVLYTTTTYRKEGIETNVNSDVITTRIEQDGKVENGAVTDVIHVNGVSVSNIDIGLIEAKKFSLGLDKAITKVTVQNEQGTKTEEFDKVKLTQYGIKAKYLSGTTVYVEYALTVTNNGDVAGYASEIMDYIPEGMNFNSSLNSEWYTGTDGNLYTKALANSELKPGESREFKLVLTKQMNNENTDIVSNTAEIANDYNVYGISDHNSTPANQAQGEDDMSTADIILTVSTGETLIYTSVILVSIMIAGLIAVVGDRVIKTKREGGV